MKQRTTHKKDMYGQEIRLGDRLLRVDSSMIRIVRKDGALMDETETVVISKNLWRGEDFFVIRFGQRGEIEYPSLEAAQEHDAKELISLRSKVTNLEDRLKRSIAARDREESASKFWKSFAQDCLKKASAKDLIEELQRKGYTVEAYKVKK